MSTVNLATVAQSEYFSRAADEKFSSLPALLADAAADKLRCGSKDLPLQSLRAMPGPSGIRLQGPSGAPAKLTNWSFSQLSRLVSAPAAYLQTLPAQIQADAINFGLSQAITDPMRLFFRRSDSGLTLRAITSDSYGRLYDADAIQQTTRIAERAGLELPPVWEGGRGGAYRGERDSFIILTSGGSIVTDPSLRNGEGTMYRGLIVRNSEIGAAAFSVLTFWYRWICGNHLLMGAELNAQTSRRHVGHNVGRSADEMLRAALAFFDRPESADVALIRELMGKSLGPDRTTVVSKGRELGLTEDHAGASYDAAEKFEADPRSVWGYAQGITRVSQEAEYQSDRLTLDLLAAKLMQRHSRVLVN